MIERCNYCRKVHDVGDGATIGGVVWKTCPEMPMEFVMKVPPRDDYEQRQAEYLRMRAKASGFGKYLPPDPIKAIDEAVRNLPEADPDDELAMLVPIGGWEVPPNTLLYNEEVTMPMANLYTPPKPLPSWYQLHCNRIAEIQRGLGYE